jgi:REP element-mobilizing transposase RayT
MSRMVDGLEFWDDVEKEALDRLLKKMAGFLGLRILTHAVMGNHFHALLEIPNKEKWLARFSGAEGEKAFWAHLATFYQTDSLKRLRERVERARAAGRQNEAEKMVDSIKRRMCDVSLWAKEVKERYSRWLNQRRKRRGTIWMERFRNVLVQNGRALEIMAAYIELNPVRAGLVAHPKDYRWCGYAAALRGDRESGLGIQRLRSLATSATIDAANAFSDHRVLIEWHLAQDLSAKEEKQPSGARLLQRQRGLSEGLAMGESLWLEDVASHHVAHFGRKRRGRPKEILPAGGAMLLRMDDRGT